ncbi:DUF3261 domain-containing protein [Dongia sp.]|uniref:DUF3261 domain-containing protein n=1 Tax=Dongia sp. TaxID=1977262 RepID=UPI0035ADD6F3
MKMRICIAGLLWLLAACGNVPTGDEANRPMFAPGHLLNLPHPGDLGRAVEWSQHIIVRHDGEVFAFDGRISVTPDRFRLVGVDGLGRRAMGVTWERSGRVTATRADWLPAQVRPGAMLADIILLYWPADVLRRSLAGSGATLREVGNTRTIALDGVDILRIDYLTGRHSAAGHLKYRNTAWGYDIDVQSIEVAP